MFRPNLDSLHVFHVIVIVGADISIPPDAYHGVGIFVNKLIKTVPEVWHMLKTTIKSDEEGIKPSKYSDYLYLYL